MEKFIQKLINCNDFREITKNYAPTDFIVAGGALSDNYFSNKHQMNFEHKDIDIFVIKKINEASEIRTQNNYMNQNLLANISKTSVSGKYNIIELILSIKGYSLLEELGYFGFWHNYINDCFDINICMQFVDFIQMKIVKTEHFIDFEKSNEIKIVNGNPHGLYNSFARCIDKYKKYKETGINFYKNKYLDILYYMVYNQCHQNSITFQTIENKRLLNFYMNPAKIESVYFNEAFTPYFKMESVLSNDQVNRTLLSEDIVSNKLKEKIKPVINNKVYYSIFSYSDLNGSKSIVNFFNNVLEGSESKRNNKLLIFYSNLFKNELIFGESYEKTKKILSNDFCLDNIAYIQKVIISHYRMVELSTKMLINGWGINEIGLFFKVLSSQKKLKHYIIGYLETCDFDLLIGLPPKEKDVMKKTKDVINGIIKERISSSVDLVERFDLSDFKYNKLIKELVSTIDLEEEGESMRHCVSGYSNKVKKGISRIFHIEYKNYKSTLELVVSNKDPLRFFMYGMEGSDDESPSVPLKFPSLDYVIGQHYSYRNENVNKVQRFIAKELKAFLNKKLN